MGSFTRSKLVVFLIVASIALGSVYAALAQQQYSGGQAVTISNVPHVIVDTAPTTPVSGIFWQSTQPVSLVSLPALAAGANKVGVTYPYTSCGVTPFTKALQAMPTSSTAIATATTCLLTLDMSNTSGGALTVTVSDNQVTPINFLNAVTMVAGEYREFSWPNGKSFISGIKVQASGAGMTYSAEGLQ
jgi:hypothetical protein